MVTSEHGHRYFAAAGLPSQLPPVGSWDAFTAYGVSKLSNVLHARELKRRLGVAGVAAHPGIVPTALGQTRSNGLHDLGVWLWWHVLAAPVAEPVARGAASVVYAALGPVEAGAYVKHLQTADPAAAALDAAAGARLWEASSRAVAAALA